MIKLKSIALLLAIGLSGCYSVESTPLPTPAPQVLKPLCSVALTAPIPVDGFVSYNNRTVHDCSESDWNGILEVRLSDQGFLLAVDIDRSQTQPGNTYAIESGAAVVWTLGQPYGGSCRSGYVTWLSDEPDWEVLVDVYCISDNGPDQFFVTGDIKGHVFNGNN